MTIRADRIEQCGFVQIQNDLEACAFEAVQRQSVMRLPISDWQRGLRRSVAGSDLDNVGPRLSSADLE